MRIVALLVLACLGCDCAEAPPPVTSTSTPVPVSPVAPGSIVGSVRFSGWLSRNHPELPPGVDRIKASSLVLSPEGALANAFVTIDSGLTATQSTPREPARLDQVGRLYDPRVLGVMKDQDLVLRNGDPHFHNVHIRSEKNPEINQGQKKGGELLLKFSVPELGIRINCDIHPWMTGWIHVSDHPFFAVTGTDGRFAISNVPAGDYELLAWHERFKDKPLKGRIRVESGKTATLDFTFKAPKK